MGWQFFRVERLDGIAVIRIDRPPVNAIGLEFAREADQVLESVLSSDDLAAVVMVGARTSFSAGLDLKRVPTYAPEEQRDLITTLNRAGGRLYGAKVPVVAAVNGHAIEVARDMAAIPPDTYARIKYQMRGEAIREITEIVAEGKDPMLESWIDPDAASASETLLREGGSS